MLKYLMIGSLILFICGQVTLPITFWISQIFFASSALCFIYAFLKATGQIKKKEDE